MSKKAQNSIELLIETVRQYPILYSKLGSVAGSVNNEEKNQAWTSIAKELREEPNVLKNKWRNLRDSYQKAVRNRRDLDEMGQLARYHPYRHEQRMAFLLPHILQEISQRKRKSAKVIDAEKIKKDASFVFAVESPASQGVEYLIEADDCEERVEEGDTVVEQAEYAQEDLLEDTEVDHSSGSEYFEEVESQHTRVFPTRTRSKTDDIEAWLSAVRESMGKLTLLNRAKAKREINEILSKYEIEQYERCQES